MNNLISMSSEFERQKNTRALLITGLISGGILVIVMMVSWTIPQKLKAEEPEYIEIMLPDEPMDINLGNNDVGSGDVQPIVTGSPSSNPVSNESDAARGANDQQASSDFEEDPAGNGPTLTKPDVKTPSKEINNNTSNQTVKAPKQEPKPKASMTSLRGSGNGGNTDLPGYNNPGSQGPGDGAGDKGMHNGDPKGTRYLDARVVRIPAQSFEDDFKESGKIALEIEVNSSGKLVNARYQVKGSTLPHSSKQYNIAMQRAREIAYPKYEGGFRQVLTFNFTVK